MVTHAVASILTEPASPSWTDELSAWSSLAVAIIALLTFGAAGVGAWVAWGQLREAQTLRRDQARAYVTVYMEPNPALNQAVELVIKNFGTTSATDVSLTATPELRRAGGQGRPDEKVRLPAAIPFLAPGQEVRTLWDVQARRINSQLPKRYDVTVMYTDAFGIQQTTSSVLDWAVLEHLLTVDIKNAHHSALALRGIENLLKGWADGTHTPKFAVYSGRWLDNSRRQEWREWETAVRAAEQRDRESPDAGGDISSSDS